MSEAICYYDLHVIDWLIWRRDIKNMAAYTMFGRAVSRASVESEEHNDL